MLGKLKGPLRERVRAEKILIKLPIHGSPFPSAHCGYCLAGRGVCVYFFECLCHPPLALQL